MRSFSGEAFGGRVRLIGQALCSSIPAILRDAPAPLAPESSGGSRKKPVEQTEHCRLRMSRFLAGSQTKAISLESSALSPAARQENGGAGTACLGRPKHRGPRQRPAKRERTGSPTAIRGSEAGVGSANH